MAHASFNHMRCLLLLLLALSNAGNGMADNGDVMTHYGIIFDAGSSGSRIHVYTWRTGGSAGEFELVEDDLLKSKPGLSSFREKPAEAGASLDTLLDYAKKKIPKERWAKTPVFLYATAGLRLVGEAVAADILRSAAATLDASPFLFRRYWATIMPGDEEAMYGWLTVNYLLGTLNGTASTETSGVIDLGGGSVQLVYTTPDSSLPDEYRGEVSFAGRAHPLYLASHLGYGLDQARDRAAGLLAAKTSGGPVSHPCVPAGHEVELSIGDNSKRVFSGTGLFGECDALYRGLFDKSSCNHSPCSFNGAHQPPISDAVSLFGFSYLYDRTTAIGLLDDNAQMFGTQKMTVADVTKAATKLCAMTTTDAKKRFEAVEDAHKWANFCGDAVYMAALLEYGFGFGSSTTLTMGNKVNGVELVWTLGAMIAKSASEKHLLAKPSDLQKKEGKGGKKETLDDVQAELRKMLDDETKKLEKDEEAWETDEANKKEEL